MNKIETIAYNLGRLRGLFNVGLKGQPSLTDQSAWLHPTLWGTGVTLGSKPRSKQEMVEQFTSWVYICASINATAVASIPLGLYVTKQTKGQKFQTARTKAVDRRKLKAFEGRANLRPYFKKGEEVDEVTNHPLLELLDNVNPFANYRDLLESTSIFQDLTGEAYWYLLRDGLRVPRQIWSIPAQYMTPIPGKTLDEFITGYRYQRGNKRIDLPIDDVICFAYPNPKNEYAGFSCVQGVADAVYVNSKMYEFEEAVFENKARMGTTFTTDEFMSKEAQTRFMALVQEKYTGATKAAKNVLLPFGVKIAKDTMTPEELSFIEGRKLVREEICIALDVPISAIVATDVNRANAESADYRHMKNGVEPRLRRIEEKLNERLCPMFDEKLFLAFDDCVPEDKDRKLKERETNLKTNTTTINEERSDMGREPVGWGDSAWFPAMMMPVSDAEAPANGGAASQVVEEAVKLLKEMG